MCTFTFDANQLFWVVIEGNKNEAFERPSQQTMLSFRLQVIDSCPFLFVYKDRNESDEFSSGIPKKDLENAFHAKMRPVFCIWAISYAEIRELELTVNPLSTIEDEPAHKFLYVIDFGIQYTGDSIKDKELEMKARLLRSKLFGYAQDRANFKK
jgi:hypothetical protein